MLSQWLNVRYWTSVVLWMLLLITDTSSSKKPIKNNGKCSYNIIIHEVDSAVKCPNKRYYHEQEESVKSKLPWLLSDEPQPSKNAITTSRFTHDAYRLGLEDLIKRVGSLETKLYAEMAENRELKNTLLLQEQSMRKMDRYVQQNLARNVTQLGHDIRHVTTTMVRHAQHYRSLDAKLSEVMLDVAEVNHYLATAEERERGEGPGLTGRGSVGHPVATSHVTTQKDIAVQAISLLQDGCAVPSNATKFTGNMNILST